MTQFGETKLSMATRNAMLDDIVLVGAPRRWSAASNQKRKFGTSNGNLGVGNKNIRWSPLCTVGNAGNSSKL